MNTTLVGVFKTAADARLAWSRLAAAGVDNTAIRLAVEEWPWDELAPSERRDAQEGRGAVKLFFLELVDRVNDAASTWFRPQLTDHFIVTVVMADPQRADQVGTILDDCGAVDIDEQIDVQVSDDPIPASLGHPDRQVEEARSLYGLSDRSVAGEESSTSSRTA